MEKLFLIIMATWLSACITIQVPQSRNEFIAEVKKGPRSAKEYVYTVNHSFRAIYNRVKQKSQHCLAKKITRSMTQGYATHVSQSIYTPSLAMKRKGFAEFTYQVHHTPAGTAKIPPGGLYMMAMDIISVGKNKTKIQLYAPTIGYTDISEAMMEWTKNKNTKCPELP